MNYQLGTELRGFLCELAEEERLKTTVYESMKGGLMAGLGAMIGGILMGPIGLFAGGTVMSGVACKTCNNFQPLHEVLAQMPEARWRKLEARVQHIMRDRGLTDVVGLIAMAATGTTVRQELVHMLVDFAQSEIGKTIKF